MRILGEASVADFAMSVRSILWAFSFAGVLTPEFASEVCVILEVFKGGGDAGLEVIPFQTKLFCSHS